MVLEENREDKWSEKVINVSIEAQKTLLNNILCKKNQLD
jgi:hypothetical protein